jgi:hypothetical protein
MLGIERNDRLPLETLHPVQGQLRQTGYDSPGCTWLLGKTKGLWVGRENRRAYGTGSEYEQMRRGGWPLCTFSGEPCRLEIGSPEALTLWVFLISDCWQSCLMLGLCYADVETFSIPT